MWSVILSAGWVVRGGLGAEEVLVDPEAMGVMVTVIGVEVGMGGMAAMVAEVVMADMAIPVVVHLGLFQTIQN
jgi:hypothetical protein